MCTGEVSCGCTEHNGRTILNEIYNTDVEHIFQLLFTDSDFFRDLLKARKTTSEWEGSCGALTLISLSLSLSLSLSYPSSYRP